MNDAVKEAAYIVRYHKVSTMVDIFDIARARADTCDNGKETSVDRDDFLNSYSWKVAHAHFANLKNPEYRVAAGLDPDPASHSVEGIISKLKFSRSTCKAGAAVFTLTREGKAPIEVVALSRRIIERLIWIGNDVHVRVVGDYADIKRRKADGSIYEVRGLKAIDLKEINNSSEACEDEVTDDFDIIDLADA